MPVDEKELEPGVHVVHISGRLVFGPEVDRVESLVRTLLQSGKIRLVFDLSSLEHADSSGIGAIVACLAETRKHGGDLRVAGANARIQRLLQTTGVEPLLSLYPTVSDAVARS